MKWIVLVKFNLKNCLSILIHIPYKQYSRSKFLKLFGVFEIRYYLYFIFVLHFFSFAPPEIGFYLWPSNLIDNADFFHLAILWGRYVRGWWEACTRINKQLRKSLTNTLCLDCRWIDRVSLFLGCCKSAIALSCCGGTFQLRGEWCRFKVLFFLSCYVYRSSIGLEKSLAIRNSRWICKFSDLEANICSPYKRHLLLRYEVLVISRKIIDSVTESKSQYLSCLSNLTYWTQRS